MAIEKFSFTQKGMEGGGGGGDDFFQKWYYMCPPFKSDQNVLVTI
jgi:hypothetical protein